MFSPIRNRFGIPGAISVIALVFAMFGGAYAASNNDGSGSKASASAQKGPRGLRGPRGKTGPVGPVGPAGAKGDKGDTGAAGSNGTNGVDGEDGVSAKTKTFAGVKGSCTEGGVEVESASPAALVCNGKKGEPGLQGEAGPLLATLPSGKTLTGGWGYLEPLTGIGAATISYPFRLAAAIPAPASIIYLKKEEGETANCPGTAEAPKAAAGKLCVYAAGEVEVAYKATSGYPKSTVGGAVLQFEGISAHGTWAVTAP